MGEDTIEIRELLKVIKSKIWIIAIVTIMTTSIGIYRVYNLRESYVSTAKVYISKGDNLVQYYSEQELEYYSKIVTIFTELSNTNGFFDNVLKKNNIDKSSEEVSAGLRIMSTETSPIFTVSYNSSELEGNKETLEAVCDELISSVNDILPEAKPMVLNEIIVTPVYPDKIKIPVLALLFGLMASVGIILVMHCIDNRILSKKQLEKIINVPVLAKLPKDKKEFKGNISDCVVKKDDTSISAEAYKGLRVSISSICRNKGIKSILVTSAVSGEGKSTVCSNLALTMGNNGSKVVLVNCDFKKIVSEGLGIMDYLQNTCKLEDIINKLSDNVYIINAGEKTNNSAEILDAVEMNNLIETLSEEFDYIIFDSAPVLLFADAAVLTSKIDATILVAREKFTKENVLKEAYEEIKGLGGNVIGCVLNRSTDKLVNKYMKEYGKESSKSKKYKRKVYKEHEINHMVDGTI